MNGVKATTKPKSAKTNLSIKPPPVKQSSTSSSTSSTTSTETSSAVNVQNTVVTSSVVDVTTKTVPKICVVMGKMFLDIFFCYSFISLQRRINIEVGIEKTSLLLLATSLKDFQSFPK